MKSPKLFSDSPSSAHECTPLSLLVSRDEFEWLESLLTRCPRSDRLRLKGLFVHILASTLREMRSGYAGGFTGKTPMIPLPSEFLRRHFRGLDWQCLTDGPPRRLYKTGFRRGSCTRVFLAPSLLRGFANIRPTLGDTGGALEFVDAVTGEIKMPERRRTLVEGERDPIRGALMALNSCKVNINSLERHLEQAYEALPLYSTPAEIASFLCSLWSYRHICWLAPGKRTADGLLEFPQPYSVTSTGRIAALGAGVQSCPREMKSAAFEQIPGVFEPWNYDVSASQMWGLIDLVEHVERVANKSFDTTWILQYLAHENPKAYYAELAGFSDLGPVEATELWKRCLYALMYGASARKGGAIEETLMKYYSDAEIVSERIASLAAATKGLTCLLTGIRGWLQNELPTFECRQVITPVMTMVQGGRHGGHKLRNACNKLASVEENRGTCLLAHLLQGLEASLIHHLTILCHKNGISVLSNQHDGLVTDREIPEPLISEARVHSGFSSARLEVKPFC